MTTTFITITKEEFINWAKENLPSPEFLLPRNGREVVVRQKAFVLHMELHIYSSIAGEESRGIGEDAIRVILFDPVSIVSVGKTRSIHRSEGATTVWQRLEERIAELRTLAEQVKICPKCGAHRVERVNGTNGNKFFGCSAFPKCPRGEELKRVYPLIGEIRETKIEMFKPEQEINKDLDTGGQLSPQLNFITPLVEENALIKTSEYAYLSYPFEFFNRVQSTILQNKFQEQDINLVLGTTTSSGKTIAAELFMGYILKVENKKVLYVSPLKSLTSEKYEAWQKTFSEYKICIMTGDYDTLSKEKMKELNEASIIVMTSEMVDSRSRKTNDERSDWMREIGLIILDESHIISTSRGHAVEVGIMRFTKICPESKILFLSATMPNVEDFRVWLTRLNGKKTEIINSTWRPTQLDWHFIQYDVNQRYKEQQEEKMSIAVNLAKENITEKFLIFVHDKNTGRQLEQILKYQKIDCFFHNADLEMKERLEIEKSFEDKEKGIRVLISTSTLAWGRSLPARNVIIVGVTRGLNEVDELDIIQSGGRAGRFGIDPKGDCYLICDSSSRWKYVINNPRKVLSTLIDEGILGFHILAEIKIGGVFNKETLQKWFDRSLARIQNKVDDNLVDRVLAKLVKMQMLEIVNGIFKVTWLGSISVSLYFYPEDIFHWYMTFQKINDNSKWDSDLALSWALGSTPSFQLGYVPKDAQNRVSNYTNHLQQLNCFNGSIFQSMIASDLYDVLTGNDKRYSIKGIQVDIDRILNAIGKIAVVKQWSKESFLKILAIRLKYGVNKELAELCELPGIGAKRAQKLWDAGIKGIDDIADFDKKKLARLVGEDVVKDINGYLALRKRGYV